MDDRLLIPLDVLPGPVPVGAPVLWQTPFGWRTWEDLSHMQSSSDHEGWTWQDRAIARGWAQVLDLTPPETDAAGYPLRIDGLDVAAGMLARAVRLSATKGVRWFAVSGVWVLDVGAETFYFEPKKGDPYRTDRHRRMIPALADIDPTSPLAPRLAIAAIMRARPWEKP